MQNKLILVCEKCGSEDIEQLEWHKVNTNEFSGLGSDYNDEEVQWCCTCEKHVSFLEKSEFDKLKK